MMPKRFAWKWRPPHGTQHQSSKALLQLLRSTPPRRTLLPARLVARLAGPRLPRAGVGARQGCTRRAQEARGGVCFLFGRRAPTLLPLVAWLPCRSGPPFLDVLERLARSRGRAWLRVAHGRGAGRRGRPRPAATAAGCTGRGWRRALTLVHTGALAPGPGAGRGGCVGRRAAASGSAIAQRPFQTRNRIPAARPRLARPRAARWRPYCDCIRAARSGVAPAIQGRCSALRGFNDGVWHIPQRAQPRQQRPPGRGRLRGVDLRRIPGPAPGRRRRVRGRAGSWRRRRGGGGGRRAAHEQLKGGKQLGVGHGGQPARPRQRQLWFQAQHGRKLVRAAPERARHACSHRLASSTVPVLEQRAHWHAARHPCCEADLTQQHICTSSGCPRCRHGPATTHEL